MSWILWIAQKVKIIHHNFQTARFNGKNTPNQFSQIKVSASITQLGSGRYKIIKSVWLLKCLIKYPYFIRKHVKKKRESIKDISKRHNFNIAWFHMWLCGTWGSSHWSVLQQGTVVHSSSLIEKVPEHWRSGAAVSLGRLQLSRHDQVVLQRAVGLKVPVAYKNKVHTRSNIFVLYGQSRKCLLWWYNLFLKVIWIENKQCHQSPLSFVFCQFHPICMFFATADNRPKEKPNSTSQVQILDNHSCPGSIVTHHKH